MRNQNLFSNYKMSIKYVNNNRLGCHVIYERAPKPAFKLDFPAHKVKVFKIKTPYVPSFKSEPIAYNPGEKPSASNSYTNIWQKTTTKLEPTTHLSPIDDPFRL